MPPLGTPLAHTHFNLNSAGIAGFFGGGEVLSTIGITHLYQGRRWFGWYNSPGSYELAKHLGRMANSSFWDTLFPGPNVSPAVVFGLDIKQGPRYIAALSGTTIPTGHLAHLTMEWYKQEGARELQGRVTRPVGVTYLAMKHVDYGKPVERLPLWAAPRGLFPTIVSIATCTMCALVYDWFSFSTILIGIICNGCTNLVVGRGKLVIECAKPWAGETLGHGILLGMDEIVVIKGDERDVNVVTKGRFNMDIDVEVVGRLDEERNVRNHHAIGVCSLLLLLQFLLQLLLVPQGSLFGQIMFLISLGASWGYNIYLSSLGVQKEKLQAEVLFRTLGNPEIHRFRAGTRTTMAVFVCLLLFHGVNSSFPEKDRARREKILNALILNDTVVWRHWRERVIEQLLNIGDKSESLSHLKENEEAQCFSKSDNELLKQLLHDAGAAFRGYFEVREGLPSESSHIPEGLEKL